MCLMDDALFAKCFGESKECIEVLLRIILGRNDITVISVHPQSWLENITCRSVRLDALASDSGGRIYDIEVQKRTGEASRKRARYYSSMLDAAALGKGMGFDALPDSFVIFITEGDAIGSGEAIYHVARKVEETGEAFGDGSEIIYVSSSLTKPETELGRLMEDMKCTDPEKMHYTVIKERTEFLKLEKEGIAIMSSMFDEVLKRERETSWNDGMIEGTKIGKQEGQKEGVIKGKLDMTKSMLADGFLPLSKIAEYSGLSLEEVENIKQNLSVS